MSETFSSSIEIAAKPEVVFDYFIEPHLLISWIGDHAVLDATPGGDFILDIQGIPIRGQFLEVTPLERVVVSWGHAGSETLPPGSTEVEFSLTPTADGTLVTVEHRKLPVDEVRAHSIGWPMFLGQLESIFA